jgi:hypothetical protein
MEGAHRQPEFMALNPNHAVPFCTFNDRSLLLALGYHRDTHAGAAR